MALLAHLSDLHLATNMGKQRITPGVALALHDSVFDTLNAINVFIIKVEKEKPDLIIITGDIYHRVVNNRNITASFANRLTRMAKVCPVIIVTGNHDSVSVTTHAFLEYSNLPLNNIEIVDSPRVINHLKAKDGTPFQIFAMGWPTPTLNDISDQENLVEQSNKMRRMVQEQINQEIKVAMDDAPSNAIRVFIGHGTVFGLFDDKLKWIHENSSEEVTFYENSFVNYDYVALGHIHLRKVKGNMVYPGSLYPTNYAEGEIPHGFALANVQRGQLPEVNFEEVFIRRVYNVLLKTSKHESTSAIIAEVLRTATPDPEALLRVKVIIDKAENEPDMMAVNEALTNHYRFVTVEKTFDVDTKVNSPDLITMTPGEKTIEYLKRYLDTVPLLDDERKMKVMIRFRSLISSI